jgi:hypothetical protein
MVSLSNHSDVAISLVVLIKPTRLLRLSDFVVNGLAMTPGGK